MKRNILFLSGGLLVGVLIGLIIILSDRISLNFLQQNIPPKVGDQIFNVEIQNLSGETTEIVNYLGKPLVINFWATWCKPCENEMPLLSRISAEYSGLIDVIGINVEEEKPIVQQYIQDHKVTFQVFIDPTGKIADKFFINGYPTTFFIDANGHIQAIRIGELDEKMLINYLDLLGVTR